MLLQVHVGWLNIFLWFCSLIITEISLSRCFGLPFIICLIFFNVSVCFSYSNCWIGDNLIKPNYLFYFLLQLELVLSSGTVCLSIYSMVAGIFGMNIPYTWNDNHGYMFKWVSKLYLLVILALCKGRICFLKLLLFVFTLQVCIITGLICAIVFVVIMSYARHKGLVGSWNRSMNVSTDTEFNDALWIG